MKRKTKLTKIGRDPKKQKGFVNPGIYKGSTMVFDSFRDYLNDIKNDDDRKTLYGINKNPFYEQLEAAISKLYKASDTVIAPIPYITAISTSLIGALALTAFTKGVKPCE